MIIEPAKNLRGRLKVPGDKSISHRAVMLGSLANGLTRIKGFLKAADCLSTIDCFRKLGVKTEFHDGYVFVFGNGLHSLSVPSDVLYTGNSGTTTRLLCGIMAGQPFSSIIDGDETIRRRPMKRVITPLSMMGASIAARNGEYCPLMIKGSPLTGIDYALPVASAQLKSALLFAGLYADGQTVIRENEPSRDHSELMLRRFGAALSSDGGIITLLPGNALSACDITVPGDISSAAFFIVAALITESSEITIENVGLNPRRTGIIDALIEMGANIEISNLTGDEEPVGTVTARSSKLHGAEIGGSMIPRMIDEIPVFAVAAACAEGQTVIKDASELLYKESNRIVTTANELKKAGADITPTNDGFIINGAPLHGAHYDSHLDHRIAMAMAVAALSADSESSIAHSEAVDISYPGFFETLADLSKGLLKGPDSAPIFHSENSKYLTPENGRGNIILIGFMGSGKTCIGKRLAEKLGFSFADTDDMIESRENLSVSEVFEKFGEAYFRKVESDIINSLSSLSRCVIATGGGAVLDPLNAARLKMYGKLVFLDSPFEKILKNVGFDQSRPLLQQKSESEVRELFHRRHPIYSRAADIILDASDSDIDAIVARMIEKI